MEGIKEIAKVYYARASEKEKNSAEEFYRKLDVNWDGKVSRNVLEKHVGLSLCSEDVFKQLDENGDGTLGFYESLALYYMANKVQMLLCNGCSLLLVGPYFSCSLCLGKGDDTFDLCCACYRAGNVAHEHSSDNLLDHHSLLSLLRSRTTEAEKILWKSCEGSASSTSKPENTHKYLKPLLEKIFGNSNTSGDLISRYSSDVERASVLDGIREIARSYYERAREEEKKPLREYFDANNVDGKISLETLIARVNAINPQLMHIKLIIETFDVYGDGALDFDGLLSAHYVLVKLGIRRCVGCGDMLFGPYFSCLLCLGKGRNTYDLCCACNKRGEFVHEHSPDFLLDHHSLLKMFREEQTQGKKGMDRLREIAKAHYEAGSEEVQALAVKFFKSMNTNGDGRINLSEFLALMKQEGYAQMQNPYFFKELDSDGNGTLDFWEVMTLYYIVKSGRPFCDQCGNFLPGIFFSCVECYVGSESSFSLCLGCYKSRECKHNHNGKTQFLDNYTLLEAYKYSHLARATGLKKNQAIPKAGVPNSSKEALHLGLKALELGISIGNIANTLCTIL